MCEDGGVYEGRFRWGRVDGIGTLMCASGEEQNGVFKVVDDYLRLHGDGELVTPDGFRVRGNFD